MSAVDGLLHARWVIPVKPQGLVLDQHTLAVHQGRIVDILPQREAQARYTARTIVELPTHALIPGLINTHTHAAMTLFRGLADDLPLMQWLNDHIWPAEHRWVNEAFVADGVRLAVAEMLRGGTTLFTDMYFFPEVTARIAQDAGLRACIGLIVLDFPTRYAQTSDEYLSRGLALHHSLAGHPHIKAMFAPHSPYAVSDAALTQVRHHAEQLALAIHMHVHETAAEVEEGIEKTGQRPLARLTRLGLLTPRLQAVHMTQLTEGEIEAVAQAGAHVIHCPESNLKLASGFCPVQRLMDAGVNVALGTDGAASNNDLDLFGEMRTTALLGKGVAGDAAALPAAEVLAMATLNGARALGLDHEIGSLEIGKAADLTAVDLGRIETQPVFDPISQIIYAADRTMVSDVWVEGRQLLAARRLTTLDLEEIKCAALTWGARIRQADAL